MPNKNYLAGRRAEHRARQMLLARGHHTVIRAAGSKGPFDLVAIGKGAIRLVQVKRGAIPKEERAELLILKSQLPFLYVTMEIWRFDKGKKFPAIEVL